eukprot:evm.model.NODE_10435_length_7355_cov_31.723318.1
MTEGRREEGGQRVNLLQLPEEAVDGIGVTAENAVNVVEVKGSNGRAGTTPEEPQSARDTFAGTVERGREGGDQIVLEEFVQALGVGGDVRLQVDEEGTEEMAVAERIALEWERR